MQRSVKVLMEIILCVPRTEGKKAKNLNFYLFIK